MRCRFLSTRALRNGVVLFPYVCFMRLMINHTKITERIWPIYISTDRLSMEARWLKPSDVYKAELQNALAHFGFNRLVNIDMETAKEVLELLYILFQALSIE